MPCKIYLVGKDEEAIKEHIKCSLNFEYMKMIATRPPCHLRKAFHVIHTMFITDSIQKDDLAYSFLFFLLNVSEKLKRL